MVPFTPLNNSFIMINIVLLFGESIFIQLNFSLKAILVLILDIPRFIYQHLMWLQFSLRHFEHFHLHQDLCTRCLGLWGMVSVITFILQCIISENFLLISLVSCVLSREDKILLADCICFFHTLPMCLLGCF